LVYTDFSIVLAGFGMTLGVSLLALVLTLLISLVGGLVRCSHARIGKSLLGLYMSLFQNTPLFVQIFFYYVLPRKGVVLSPFAVGCLGLALYTGAFVQAIPKQLSEAAMSQGFSYLQTMFHVIIPQAMKIALPSLTNQAAT
jgi:putative glutamine transport system permease protein